MAVTITSTAYNGDVVSDIYKIFGTGFEVIEKGSARVETGIRTKRALPSMQLADDPVGAYERTPTGETADTDYEERSLSMTEAMLYELINLDDWHEIWDQFASAGSTFTNLALNPEIARAVFELYKNKVGKQFSELFWNGDVSGSGDLINGIITLAAADSDVIDVTNVGVITSANVIDVLEDVYQAIPAQFIDDEDYAIHMSTIDWKKLQSANVQAKKSTTGVLTTNVENMYLNHRIKHYSGIPENTIVGAKGTLGTDSNLVFGFFATPDAELAAPKIMPLQNNSDQWFVRVNFKLGAQYREGSEIVLYQGS